VGYSALFPATASGAYDSATTANRTLVFIFMLLFRHRDYPSVFLVERQRFSFCQSPVPEIV
jgi:hypothetical protein